MNRDFMEAMHASFPSEIAEHPIKWVRQTSPATPLSQVSTAPCTPNAFPLCDEHFDPHKRLSHFSLDGDSYEEVFTVLEEDTSDTELLPPPAQPLLDMKGTDLLQDDTLQYILSLVAEVGSISHLSLVDRRISALLKSEAVWAGQPVNLSCTSLSDCMPQLDTWLGAWRLASKLIVPKSSELITQLSDKNPALPLEIGWRFDNELKGSGVEVCNGGRSVKRAAEEEDELVALADAPLPMTIGDNGSKLPYLEVILDDRSWEGDCGDGLNDFGVGVTARRPSKAEVGAVADEVPLSWVVDFSKNFVTLSVNNQQAAKGSQLSGEDLEEGDRVGLLFTAQGSIEIYINGKLMEHLTPHERDRVPEGVELFPVLDLYGCTTQISRTYSTSPTLK